MVTEDHKGQSILRSERSKPKWCDWNWRCLRITEFLWRVPSWRVSVFNITRKLLFLVLFFIFSLVVYIFFYASQNLLMILFWDNLSLNIFYSLNPSKFPCNYWPKNLFFLCSLILSMKQNLSSFYLGCNF